MSTKAVLARDNLYDLLKAHATQHNLGYVFNDGMVYEPFGKEKSIGSALKPNISFIRAKNLSLLWKVEFNYPGLPDLAVEVISPSNVMWETVFNTDRYLEVGVEQVWIVYPKTEEIYQYWLDPKNINNTLMHRTADVFEPETLFPDLKIVVADLFKLPQLD